MSLSKRLYEEGYVGKIECKYPLLDVGKRFTYDLSNIKIEHGTWEVVSNEQAPLYKCKRVLKNGKLSKSGSLENLRNFHESEIYRALR
ncbi:hypothetical protein [Pseudobacillus wudalianchiensis]|uniref:Uncharacterized protein n=1 Tax=Pseudobacillus wudalianchiensis TaxID=1743143 RepID=A0A1B9AN38_9BACI|nr:hypothetical protein [Bacillus wudalianchiensis]OCA85215.1 hypothetical protein A8F95_11105 [Bacillus wudalianchiensis]